MNGVEQGTLAEVPGRLGEPAEFQERLLALQSSLPQVEVHCLL